MCCKFYQPYQKILGVLIVNSVAFEFALFIRHLVFKYSCRVFSKHKIGFRRMRGIAQEFNKKTARLTLRRYSDKPLNQLILSFDKTLQ